MMVQLVDVLLAIGLFICWGLVLSFTFMMIKAILMFGILIYIRRNK